jgi:hypothetical protein
MTDINRVFDNQCDWKPIKSFALPFDVQYCNNQDPPVSTHPKRTFPLYAVRNFVHLGGSLYDYLANCLGSGKPKKSQGHVI